MKRLLLTFFLAAFLLTPTVNCTAGSTLPLRPSVQTFVQDDGQCGRLVRPTPGMEKQNMSRPQEIGDWWIFLTREHREFMALAALFLLLYIVFIGDYDRMESVKSGQWGKLIHNILLWIVWPLLMFIYIYSARDPFWIVHYSRAPFAFVTYILICAAMFFVGRFFMIIIFTSILRIKQKETNFLDILCGLGAILYAILMIAIAVHMWHSSNTATIIFVAGGLVFTVKNIRDLKN